MPDPSAWPALLYLFSWTALGYVAIFYLYGWHDAAYKIGKYALVFMIGAVVGAAVI
jgi:hypothetical protein